MASWSDSEGGVHRGKLLVHIAENGHSIELDCDECTLVEEVQRYLESVSGIHSNDQLLLCVDMKLESARQLSAYGLPSDDREVYLFNRARMRSTSPAPAPERFEMVETLDPQSPTSSHNPHPLDDASDPALKALPSYERQFRYHYMLGHAIYARTLLKYDICERLLREQKVQEKALEIARGNLEHFYRMILQNYADFVKHYSMQHRSHSSLLVNFGRDLEKLRSCKLLPPLQNGNRKCLIDLVKEENLRKTVEDCSNSHGQFENKVSEFKQEFEELKHSTEHLFSSKTLVHIKDLELAIKEHQRYITEQKSIMQTLSKDVSTVKKLMDDCLSSQLSSSLRPHDAVSALGPMYDGHDKSYLPKMQICERTISSLLDFCRKKKDEMNMFVQNYMQKIAYIQFTIKDVRYKFSVFTEALKRQSDQFEHLKVVRGIGPAYRACLAEIVRRRASMKLYMGMAGQLAERLATKREAELRRREEFLKVYSSYIPRDILASMGLYDTPNQCDVNLAPSDTNLLDIDISDIERYAPEYLVALSFKGEKEESWKGSSSLSHDSLASEVGESSLDATDRYNSDDILEDSELVEIAGTSKMEVENAKLKAELASAIALISSYCTGIEYDSLDDSNYKRLLKDAAEKTAEALHLKDEYGKHLISMLKNKQMQCESYEKRIQELEQRLSNQYVQEHKFSDDKNASSSVCSTDKADRKSEVSGEGEALMVSVAMDDASCASNSEHVKSGVFDKHGRPCEDLDDNMTDSSGIINPQLDSSMLEPNHDHLHLDDKHCKETLLAEKGIGLAASSTADSISQPLNTLLFEADGNLNLDSKRSGDLVLELQRELAEKSSTLSEKETKLENLMEEIFKLGRELEIIRKLLDECQMNCAHLENCLHEAREEAQTHLCAAERRASEYSALHASGVKMRSLFDRLKTCVSSGSVSAFAESLQALSQSFANSIGDKEDVGSVELRECIRTLADKVGALSRHHADLLDRYSNTEAANDRLTKELVEKKELVNTLYMKHQLEKQANKEKISFGRLEVHELAAFILNSAGRYEGINRNCHHYYLSTESVALFIDHLPQRPSYIIGQIVHIERLVVSPIQAERNNSDRVDILTTDKGSGEMLLNSTLETNPYGLPIGCEYFIVTVAMLPDTTIHSQPTS